MFSAVNQISGLNSWQNNGVNVEYTGTINKDDQQIQCALNGPDVYPGCVSSKKRSKSSTGQKKKPRGEKSSHFQFTVIAKQQAPESLKFSIHTCMCAWSVLRPCSSSALAKAMGTPNAPSSPLPLSHRLCLCPIE